MYSSFNNPNTIELILIQGNFACCEKDLGERVGNCTGKRGMWWIIGENIPETEILNVDSSGKIFTRTNVDFSKSSPLLTVLSPLLDATGHSLRVGSE
jgi:hypothetical protein